MVFSLSSLWWRRTIGLWKLPDGRDWLRGKQGLVLMGGAMLSKFLVEFSVAGWGCVPSLLFTWGQTLVEVMMIMATSFKRSHARTATLSAPSSASGHRWHMPPPETPEQSRASLDQSLVGSLLLSPGSWCTKGKGWASLVAQPVKNFPAMWKTWVRSLGWEDPLEKGKSTHSSILD